MRLFSFRLFTFRFFTDNLNRYILVEFLDLFISRKNESYSFDCQKAFFQIIVRRDFQKKLNSLLKNYAGRPSPLYFGGNYYYQGAVSAPNYRPSNSNNNTQSSSGSGPNTSSPVLSRPITKPPSNTNQNKGRKKDGN